MKEKTTIILNNKKNEEYSLWNAPSGKNPRIPTKIHNSIRFLFFLFFFLFLFLLLFFSSLLYQQQQQWMKVPCSLLCDENFVKDQKKRKKRSKKEKVKHKNAPLTSWWRWDQCQMHRKIKSKTEWEKKGGNKLERNIKVDKNRHCNWEKEF